MFKRLYWLTVGSILGFTAAVWGMVRARQAAAKLTPAGMRADADAALRQLRRDLGAALREGREGMRETEDRLRADLAGRRGTPR
ncbi:hypothetical protein [Actinomarinicola tropica]|uniref:YtxH domain-containing protein n=1 Tax=Actinomarinicola tropica TaxID=2789776 RepID=A0A5Q2RHZ1_9ACTN|nr:hypothetical protein [Actinomarinicola tropica]QGG95164.1 hypothetical protein GH723_08665 [Actinomarinicola tropica]